MRNWKNYLLRQIWRVRNPGLRPPPGKLRNEFPQYDIGRGTYAPNLSVLGYDSDRTLSIGNYCSIAARVEILLGGEHRYEAVSTYPFGTFNKQHRHLDHFRSKGDVRIGSDVWIGRGVTICSGVQIGHGAVLATEALIVKDVPAYAIVGGNPAKILKYRFTQEQIAKLLAIAWWDWPEDKIIRHAPQLASDSIDAFIEEHL